MIKFQYDITKHSSDEFTQLVYFCTDSGECDFDQLPNDQLHLLVDRFNEKGSQGWGLVQVFFGGDGAIAFWKRAL